MTFTYSPFTTDRDRVRFHLADTNSAAPIFTDEQLDAQIVESGSWQLAVIDALEYLIALTSQPGFTADWLTVDLSKANAAYRALLSMKNKKFGTSVRRASAVHTYRADSNLTSAPDWASEADYDADIDV